MLSGDGDGYCAEDIARIQQRIDKRGAATAEREVRRVHDQLYVQRTGGFSRNNENTQQIHTRSHTADDRLLPYPHDGRGLRDNSGMSAEVHAEIQGHDSRRAQPACALRQHSATVDAGLDADSWRRVERERTVCDTLRAETCSGASVVRGLQDHNETVQQHQDGHHTTGARKPYAEGRGSERYAAVQDDDGRHGDSRRKHDTGQTRLGHRRAGAVAQSIGREQRDNSVRQGIAANLHQQQTDAEQRGTEAAEVGRHKEHRGDNKPWR